MNMLRFIFQDEQFTIWHVLGGAATVLCLERERYWLAVVVFFGACLIGGAIRTVLDLKSSGHP